MKNEDDPDNQQEYDDKDVKSDKEDEEPQIDAQEHKEAIKLFLGSQSSQSPSDSIKRGAAFADGPKLQKQYQVYAKRASDELQRADAILSDNESNPQHALVCLGKLERYNSRLQNINDVLLHILQGEDEVEEQVETAAAMEEAIIEKIELLKHRPVPGGTNQPTLPAQPAQQRAEPQVSVRLPKLDMKKFDGNPIEFQQFWDNFQATIDSSNLADVEKLKYLKSLLERDAYRVADGYQLTTANYKAVKDALFERFGNNELAVFSHFTAMLELPPATNDLTRLQDVYDACDKHIRSLVALKLDESTFEKVFIPIMLSKLPTNVKVSLHRANGSQTWTLANLRQLLKDEIRARDFSQRNFGAHSTFTQDYHESKVPNQVNPSQFVKKRLKPHQGTSKFASGVLLPNHGKTSNRGKCAFCSKNHNAEDCNTYTDYDSRREQLTPSTCLHCLRTGHRVADCTSTFVCRICRKPGHHTALCYARFKGDAMSKTHNAMKMNPGAKSFVPGNAVASHGTGRSKTYTTYTNMQTAVAPLRSPAAPDKSVRIRCLFDTAGFRSYVTTDVKERLKLKVVDKENVSLGVFEDTKRRNKTYDVVACDVMLPDKTTQRIRANVTDTITCPIYREPPDAKRYKLLASLKLAEPLSETPESLDIDVLIGGDHYYDFIDGEYIRLSDGMVLISSKLGYITAGVSSTTTKLPNHASLLTTHSPLPASNFDLERFWRLEDIGVKDIIENKDDDAALKAFTDSVRYVDGRYSVALPWKLPTLDLPSNKKLAYRRLESIVKKLKKDPDILQQYDKTIRDQHDRGIIEDAPRTPSDSRNHYLAHHGVIKPGRATTKLRVVFDASAKSSSKHNSLNDCLHTGPLLLTDLCGLLLRFRCQNIAFVADIEKAFLQIEIQEEDRNVTRFLWLKDIQKPLQPNNIAEYRFRMVVFGVNCSPFLLAATVKHHLQKIGTNVAKDVERNIYVDNVISGSQTVEQAITYCREAKDIFGQASMNLREFYSNSPALIDALSEPDRGKATPTKVLGLIWDTEADTLSCSSSHSQHVTTKRQVLQSIASIYDPLGFVSPVTVTGKMLMQKLWKAKLSWDETLPQDLLSIWNQLELSLQDIPNLHINRKTMSGRGTASGYQIHVFCDASADAYAAVIYLREEHAGSDATVELLFSKTRVSPIKKLTIPKLELMAAFVGSKLLHFVTQELDFLQNVDSFLWTDNQSILHWILGKEVTTVFVSNRVKKIKALTSERKVDFRYVPTMQNPADIASRGSSLPNLANNDLWWHGPKWLAKHESGWPTNDRILGLLRIQEPEEIAQTTLVVQHLPIELQFVDHTRFSKVGRLIRTTAWVKRFIHNARRTMPTRQMGELTANEIVEAKRLLDRSSQARTYPKVLSGSKDSRTQSFIQQLDLFVDQDGIIRSRGRLANANLSADTLQPKLLSGDDPYTQLVIQAVHQRSNHVGTAHTLAELRQQYWIPKGRSIVKQVVQHCLLCRRVAARGFKVPGPPQLPQCRVDASFPFENVGLDYLGPVLITTGDTPNRKVWICLFTCAVVRAIHLEVVADLTAEQFLLCLRRFGSIYGYPKMIVSDNASQFVAARKCMTKTWQTDPTVQQFSSSNGITWKFITEKAPWMGGFYERLIGLVKMSLRRTLAHTKLTLIELQTVAYEVSSTLNTRPLDYVSSETNDPFPLCPSNFLLTSRTLGQTQQPDDGHDDGDKDTLIAKYRRVQNVLTSFWKQWQRQYLIGLRERSFQHDQRNRAAVVPQVGMTVTVQDDGPRGLWKMGRITALKTSHDGKVRSASVLMPNLRVLNRPIKKLSPLEYAVDPPGQNNVVVRNFSRLVAPGATSHDSEDELEF